MAEKKEVVDNAYRLCFNTDAGRIVLDDLQKSYSKRCSHTPGDPYETAFREGSRRVVLRIETKLEDKDE